MVVSFLLVVFIAKDNLGLSLVDPIAELGEKGISDAIERTCYLCHIHPLHEIPQDILMDF